MESEWCSEPENSKLDLSSFQLCFRTDLKCYIECKKLDYLGNWKSQIGHDCNMVDDHCLQAMKSCIIMPTAVLID